jgi:hypothetical protein
MLPVGHGLTVQEVLATTRGLRRIKRFSKTKNTCNAGELSSLVDWIL